MSTPDHPDEFSRRLADTLERSLDAIDADTLAHLAHARRDALNHRARVRRVIGGLALAAGIASVAVLPWYAGHSSQKQQQQRADADMSYLAADPQLLADMDMLQVLGESGQGANSSGS